MEEPIILGALLNKLTYIYNRITKMVYEISMNQNENDIVNNFIYLTTLLTSPIEFSLYFQNYVRQFTQNFREVRKIYEMGLGKIMRVNLLF